MVGTSVANDLRPVIEENGVRLRLNIVDTPGYGDQVNNDRWYLESFFRLSSKRANQGLVGIQLLNTSRTSIQPIFGRSSLPNVNATSRTAASIAACSSSSPPDMRKPHWEFFLACDVHIILTIDSSLKPIDIVVLKKLSDVVNVVPVIAKADSLTLEERQAFKERIKEEFAFHNLKMYPYDNDELDDEERATNANIKVHIPSKQLDGTLGMKLTKFFCTGHYSLRCCW